MTHSILTTVQIILASGLFFSCLILMLLCLMKPRRHMEPPPPPELEEAPGQVSHLVILMADPTLN
jgi:hypothetical protein